MYSLSVSASHTSSCPNHNKGLVEIKCRGRVKTDYCCQYACLCVHMCSINLQWREKKVSIWKGMKPWTIPTFQNVRSFQGYKPRSVALKSVVPHSNPLLQSTCFNWSIMFSSTKLLAAQWVGPPSLGSGFCQRSVFCSYFRGKALHLVLGREGNFPLKCSLSLFPPPPSPVKVYPLEIFNFQDLFLHRVHTLFYVVWLSFLLTNCHPRALLILAEGEECCLF